MIISCITLLTNNRAQAIPEEIGTTIKPTAVTDNVTEIVLAPITATALFD